MKTFKGRGRNLAQNRKHGEKREKQEGVEVSVYWGVSAHHDSQKWVCSRPPKLMGDELRVAKQNVQLESAISQMDLLNMVQLKLL